jgi:GNAT superfamily N-acetyltransferase
MIIRDGRPEEAATIIDLWNRAYGDNGGNRQRSDLDRILAGQTVARLLVAEDEDRIIGTLIAGFDGWRGNMYGMAVEPGARRRGIGTELVREAEAWLKTQGCNRIAAMVVMDHPWATGFWSSAGYYTHDFMRRYVHDLD